MSKIYPEGIRTFAPHAGAPDFVKGKVVITLDDFFAWIKANPDYKTEYNGKKQVKFDLLEGQKGLYFALDNYTKKEMPFNNEKEDETPF